MAAGPVALQLRSPSLPAAPLAQLARELDWPSDFLFVNDRVDLVPHLGAAGVHLPSRGLSVADARGLLGANAMIGRSTHSPTEARAAWDDGADYVFLGPIWDTPSHPGRPALGPTAIEHAAPARVVAIGGVTAARVERCRDAGAWGVAAISALWTASDPNAVAARMLLCLTGSTDRPD